MKHRGGVLIASGNRLAGGGGGDPDPPDPPGETVSPPGSIDPTGVVNVSAELQAWINAQVDGSTFDFTGRTYRVDQQLNLWFRNDLTMTGGTFLTDDPTGDGSTYAEPSGPARGRSFWDLKYCTDIAITGMTLEGPHHAPGTYVLPLEAQMGFNILGCTNVDIGFCNISSVYGDFAYWGLGPIGGEWNDNCHVHDCICDGNGRQGFALVAARNCSMVNNTLDRMARAFVDLEPNGATLFGADNILIEGNQVGFHNLAFIASGGVGPVDNITVRNNIGHGGCNISSIVRGSAGSRDNWIFDGNTSDVQTTSGAGYLIECTEMVNVTVINNVQPIGGGMALCYFNHCTGVTNQGNTSAGGTYSRLDSNSTYVKDCGNRLTATGAFNVPEACVTNFGTPKQYAGLTAWYDAFQATNADFAVVDSMTDFSGNARHLVSSGAARPTMRHSIAGKLKKCYQFDGVDDYVGNTIPLSNYITNSAYTIFVVFEAITIGSAADNDAVWSDSAGVHGLYMHSVPDAYALNNDGTADSVTKALTLNDCTLMMLRHEGGNLYVSKDGGAETSIASGNTTTLAGLVRIGANHLGNQFANILVYEINSYNVALTTAQILDRTNRLILDWGVSYHYGCVDTFTRANGTIGTSEAGAKRWSDARPSTITEWSVVSNKAMCTTGDPVSGENITYLDAGLSDYTLTVEVDGTKGGTLVFRYANAANFYIFAVGGSGYLFRITDAGWNQVGSIVTGLPTTGTQIMKVVLLGTSVKTYLDATLVHDETITHLLTATKCGLRVPTEYVSANITYDNFLVVP